MNPKFEGIKKRNFGIEIEMTGLTRQQAAQAVGKLFGTEFSHYGGYYDRYSVKDAKGRKWEFVFDGSIQRIDRHGNPADSAYSVELNSPVLGYEDIPLLQEVVRTLRRAGGKCSPEYKCGTHIHISADDFTPQQIRNLVNIFASKEDYLLTDNDKQMTVRHLVNIFASKEDYLWDALQVSSAREQYCHKCDHEFVEQLNRKKPKTMEEISRLWYKGDMEQLRIHYSDTRYKALNLHSFFQHGHYEVRCCNSSLHAGEIRSQIVLALAINNAAMTKKYCRPHKSHSDNMRYSFRVWLLDLGLIGDEFKNCRKHLLKHLDGNIAWRNPEDAIAQRERLKQARLAAHQQEQSESPDEQETEAVGMTM